MKQIRRGLSILVTGMVLLSGAAWAGPYAEMAEVKAGTSDMAKMVLGAAVVPDEADVGIPAYPGAKIFQTAAPNEMVVNGEKHLSLPLVRLLSPDDVDTIVEWYKKQLPSYLFQNMKYVGGGVFWRKKGDYNLFDTVARSTNVNVSVGNGNIYRDDFPWAKAVIDIYYRPAQ